ncbi:MAG: hypothetical protein M3P12_01720 [Gemmatimonadota bacterium]|nr:hypothetical protein [Gemmatimonadota bacterium]
MKGLLVFPIALATFAWPLRAQDTTATTADTGYVEYHESPISLPLGIGLRIPSYDRVNGLTVPWGPQLSTSDETLQLDLLVSYRSNLGKWDPSLEGFFRPGTANEVKLYAGRGTFTNDSWIRSDIVNSLGALFVGSDARNYYRADRVALRLTRSLTVSSVGLTPFLGGSFERDWSTGSIAPTKTPWSFFGREGRLKMRRLNPPVANGHINSILGGTGLLVSRGGLEAKLDVAVEHALSTSFNSACTLIPANGICLATPSSFTQATLDSRVTFPTFGSQTFAFIGHALLTGSGGGNIPPPQRFGYLGGSGTLATVDLLALGGDRLLYLQGDYTIPIERIQLPFLGSPFLGLRYAAGNAGIATLPALIQNVGVGAGVSIIRVDYTIDPAQNRSPLSRRSAVTVGVSLSL